MHSNNNKSYYKAILLIIFIVITIYLVRYSPISQYLNKTYIQEFVAGFGTFGPIIFILIYAIGICIFLPGTLLTSVGAIMFGTKLGFIYNLIGATIGASIAFFIGRYFGRDFAKTLIGGKLKKYDDSLEHKGFETIFYLRLLFFPFTPLNFGAGLTKVKFKDYFLGTFIGIIPGSFIITFFIDTLTNISNLGDLLHWKVIFAIGLFIISLFIPKIVKRIRKK